MSEDLKFTVRRPPAYGELTDVLPGLFWVRLPVPMALNHVNCWVLDNGPDWTLVDCGMNTDDIFEIWDRLWRGLLRSRPLQRRVTNAPAGSAKRPAAGGRSGRRREETVSKMARRARTRRARRSSSDNGRSERGCILCFSTAFEQP